MDEMLLAAASGSIFWVFCASWGLLTRSAMKRGSRWLQILAVLQLLLLLIPAIIYLLAYQAGPLWLRLPILGLGLLSAWAAWDRPRWIPAAVWQQAAGRRLLALCMALAALWSTSHALLGPSIPSLILAAFAGLAGLSSLRAAA